MRGVGWRRALLRAGLALVVLLVLAQVVPYGRAHTNPPVTQEPKWDSPQTRALAVRACFDCHSNETKWRWYSNVAPASWLIQRDVDAGRSTLNFSEWDKPQEGGGDAVEAVRGGGMPPWYYLVMHANAKLSSAEKDALARGLQATFAASPPKGGGG
jgi:mono/diheme cytochrome c family protein